MRFRASNIVKGFKFIFQSVSARCWIALFSVLFSNAALCEILMLNTALDRVIAAHPALKTFNAYRDAREAELSIADSSPQWSIGISVENALGDGPYKGLDAAEGSLTLAGVLERGGKREARRALAAARLDELGVDRAALQIDILAEATRRYLDIAALDARREILALELSQRERMVIAARKRFLIGAAPEAMALSAEAEVAKLNAALIGTSSSLSVAQNRLALMWGGEWDRNAITEPVPTAIPPLPVFETFKNSLKKSPALLRFASEARIRDSRIRLAVASRAADVSWQVGIRRLEASNDLAAIGGISIPVGANRRGSLEESIAKAERSALNQEKQSVEMQLESALLEAWASATASSQRASAIESEVLPRLLKAASNAERAYKAGAISYIEWSDIQDSVNSARIALLEARVEWRNAMIEIQRLTAEPVVAPRFEG